MKHWNLKKNREVSTSLVAAKEFGVDAAVVLELGWIFLH